MSKYWKNRAQDALYNDQLNIATLSLADQYIRCFEKTKRDLEVLFREINEERGTDALLVSDLYRYNRYYELLNNLNKNLSALGQKELAIGDKALTDMYEKNILIVGKELHFTPIVDTKRVKEAINRVWCADGKNWSDRIWGNKSLLETKIINGIVDCVAAGKGYVDIAKQLEANFSVGFSQASRIARTELAYVQVASTLDRYADAGVEKYEFYHSHDDKVCEGQCEKLDGKQFYIKDAVVGENCPPMHPNCRCTILPIIGG